MQSTTRILVHLAVVLLVGGVVAPARAQTPETRELTLAPGEQKILPGEGIDAISTGAAGIADVRITDDQKEVVIVGLAPGETTLLILMLDGRRIQYRITVSRIRARRNIRLDFYFVQLSKDRVLRMGVGWPTSISAQATGQLTATAASSAPDAVAATATVVTQILPRLDFARDYGWAKVLQHARVVMANGEQGSYASGGEANFRLANGLTIDVERINFGTQIKARASYDNVTGRIQLHIQAEVSTLTAPGADGLPGRTISNVDTSVNLELGQSIALAGLFSDGAGKSTSGFPLLSQIPVLGYLFGTHAHRHERTENVVFVVPTLVGGVSLDERDRVSEALDVYRSYSGSLPGPLIEGVGNDASPRLEAPAPRAERGRNGRRKR